MFTLSTKKFGIWREERVSNKVIHFLMSNQFVFTLSILAFVVWLTYICIVKIRQDFFFIESLPISLFKDRKIDKDFLISERPAAITILARKVRENSLKIYFETGENFSVPEESNELMELIKKRRKNIIYTAMILRLNDPKNSRLKVWTEKNITFSDIQLIMKMFSSQGFDSFDFAVER